MKIGAFCGPFERLAVLQAVAVASEQFAASPLVAVFDFGYGEIERQVKQRGALVNKASIERSLQLGISEEVTKLEQNMNWLATVASVSPFIGLFGTVWGIIDAFQGLGNAGSASLRAVAPGISEASDYNGDWVRGCYSGRYLLQRLWYADQGNRHSHGRLCDRVPEPGGAGFRQLTVLSVSQPAWHFHSITVDAAGADSRFAGPSAMAEINIVPLVDVVLVLLIIFMITANVMEFGLDIQVPRVRRVQNTAQDLPVVSIQ